MTAATVADGCATPWGTSLEPTEMQPIAAASITTSPLPADAMETSPPDAGTSILGDTEIYDATPI